MSAQTADLNLPLLLNSFSFSYENGWESWSSFRGAKMRFDGTFKFMFPVNWTSDISNLLRSSLYAVLHIDLSFCCWVYLNVVGELFGILNFSQLDGYENSLPILMLMLSIS